MTGFTSLSVYSFVKYSGLIHNTQVHMSEVIECWIRLYYVDGMIGTIHFQMTIK